MQRPNAAQLTYGSATVVLATVALLLLSRTTTTLGITVISLAGLLLGLLVAVTMPVRTSAVKTAAPATPPLAPTVVPAAAPPAGNEPARAATARVGAGADTRTGS
ncbi:MULTISPECIES: hypothetical protein [unclassified Streptomyces]|uniref:hypothetical protein n=1 Tax=unclassified Streptomyces TaxID=2593676 RepID=UPI0006FEFCE6|nr:MULTISPECIES: hypothetical protein [unclassified Streptomyces]KQX52721.1 hypothetical protein ASD33_05455 [Streptomyces sp. Root1304]KRA89636.1 hypothetical protein ASE09_05460 [Streptomyces sp. Root66D1]